MKQAMDFCMHSYIAQQHIPYYSEYTIFTLHQLPNHSSMLLMPDLDPLLPLVLVELVLLQDSRKSTQCLRPATAIMHTVKSFLINTSWNSHWHHNSPTKTFQETQLCCKASYRHTGQCSDSDKWQNCIQLCFSLLHSSVAIGCLRLKLSTNPRQRQQATFYSECSNHTQPHHPTHLPQPLQKNQIL